MFQVIIFGAIFFGQSATGTENDVVCKRLTRNAIVPPMPDDKTAQFMCGHYWCKQDLGTEWDFTGKWWQSGSSIGLDSGMSVCECARTNCDCTVPMGPGDSKTYLPYEYNMARYFWHDEACPMGWTQTQIPGFNITGSYGTCRSGELGPCPWEDRDNVSGVMMISPEHCRVKNVTFWMAGGVPHVDHTSPSWLGVKLLDKYGDAVRTFNNWQNSDTDFHWVRWNDLDGECYRLAIYDGVAGPWSHVLVKQIDIWGDIDNRMLHDLQCSVGDEQSGGDLIWDQQGDRIVDFDVDWGVDTKARYGRGGMTVGASYIHKNYERPTVVTDVMIATVKEVVDDYAGSVATCPRGYERACYWMPDTGKKMVTMSYAPKWTISGDAAALCMRKEPCMSGQMYVSRIVAEAGNTNNEGDVPKKSENCDLIGHWNPTGTKSGAADAKSWTSNKTGGTWVGLYQCKETCPNKQCKEVRIRAIEVPRVGSVNESGDASGDSITLDKTFPNCGHTNFTFTAQLNTERTYEDMHTYTLSQAVSHSFESSIAASITIKAEVGIKPPIGETVSTSAANQFKVSEDMAWDKTITTTNTTINSVQTSVSFHDTTEYEVPAGYVTRLKVNVTAIQYSTNFVAEADCLNDEGIVIESTQLSGIFKGRVYRQMSNTEIWQTTSCDQDDYKCTFDV